MNKDYIQCVLKWKGREMIIDNWDKDKEISIETEHGDGNSMFYLSPEQANEVVKYLTRRLNEIGELDQ